MPPAQEVSAVVGRQKSGGRITYRETFPISASALQRDLRLSRYSMAARSRAVMIPSLSDACAFQTRTFPSSEPESTNRESPVYSVDMTLPRRHSASVICSPTIAVELVPLHAFCVIDLRGGPPSFLPYSHCPVPATADELETRRAIVSGLLLLRHKAQSRSKNKVTGPELISDDDLLRTLGHDPEVLAEHVRHITDLVEAP